MRHDQISCYSHSFEARFISNARYVPVLFNIADIQYQSVARHNLRIVIHILRSDLQIMDPGKDLPALPVQNRILPYNKRYRLFWRLSIRECLGCYERMLQLPILILVLQEPPTTKIANATRKGKQCPILSN